MAKGKRFDGEENYSRVASDIGRDIYFAVILVVIS